MALVRWVGRTIGMDVHRSVCVFAICEGAVVRSAGRVPSTPDGLGAWAQSLERSDRVALQVTGSCWEVERILETSVERAVVLSPDHTGIVWAALIRDSKQLPFAWDALQLVTATVVELDA